MPKEHEEIVEERLGIIIELLQILLASQLSKDGVPQVKISKRLHLANAKVGKMLEGIKRQS